MVKTWEISVKGSAPAMYVDSQTGKRFQDTKNSYYTILFKGTEDECGVHESGLMKKGFSILDTTEFLGSDRDKVMLLYIRAASKACNLLESDEAYTERVLFARAVSSRIWKYYMNKFN